MILDIKILIKFQTIKIHGYCIMSRWFSTSTMTVHCNLTNMMTAWLSVYYAEIMWCSLFPRFGSLGQMQKLFVKPQWTRDSFVMSFRNKPRISLFFKFSILSFWQNLRSSFDEKICVKRFSIYKHNLQYSRLIENINNKVI